MSYRLLSNRHIVIMLLSAILTFETHSSKPILPFGWWEVNVLASESLLSDFDSNWVLVLFFFHSEFQVNCRYDIDWSPDFGFLIIYIHGLMALESLFPISLWSLISLNVQHIDTLKQKLSPQVSSLSIMEPTQSILLPLIKITLGSAAKLGATHARTMTVIKLVPKMASYDKRTEVLAVALQLQLSDGVSMFFTAYPEIQNAFQAPVNATAAWWKIMAVLVLSFILKIVIRETPLDYLLL